MRSPSPTSASRAWTPSWRASAPPACRPCSRSTANPTSFPPSLDLVAYRIVQEALTNVVKHAGPGTVARVLVRIGGTGIELEITNGPPAPAPGAALATALGPRARRHAPARRAVRGSSGGGRDARRWLPRARTPAAAVAGTGHPGAHPGRTDARRRVPCLACPCHALRSDRRGRCGSCCSRPKPS